MGHYFLDIKYVKCIFIYCFCINFVFVFWSNSCLLQLHRLLLLGVHIAIIHERLRVCAFKFTLGEFRTRYKKDRLPHFSDDF